MKDPNQLLNQKTGQLKNDSKYHFITIKDIAKALNISVSTVSRAMCDAYDVSKETREKVLAMAVQLNYKPNLNATGLVHRSTRTIGIFLPTITNYYFSTLVTGVQEVAHDNGFNIILFLTNDSSTREREIADGLTLSSLDGILASVSSTSDTCDHFQKIIDSGVPVVFFDRVPETIDTSKVMQDDFNGAFEAVEHLINSGYSQIAHIAGPKGLMFTEKRLMGYKEALRKNNLHFKEEWIVYSGFTQKDGENDTEILLNLNNRPNAIFAVNDRKAIGVIQALKKHGIIAGRGMGVMGFTNDPVSEIISPTLSTIAEPAFEVGKISCELLLKHIRKKNFTPQEIILPGKLMARESTRLM